MKVYTEAKFDWQQSESLVLNKIDHDIQGFKRIIRKIDDWRDCSRNETDFASGLELSID